MAFQSTQPVQIIVCPNCSGKGCTECGNFGVYGLGQDKTLIFGLPPYLAVEKRFLTKRIYLIKRLAIFVLLVIFVFLTWKVIGQF